MHSLFSTKLWHLGAAKLIDGQDVKFGAVLASI